MSDTQTLENFSQEELVRIVRRDRWVKDQLHQRTTSLLVENLELMAIVHELQGDLASTRAHLEQFTTPQEVTMDDVVTTAAFNGGQ